MPDTYGQHPLHSSSRKGRPRRRLQATVRAREPNCHICGYPIDPTLPPGRDTLASDIDELVTVHDGGSTIDPANCRNSHAMCNRRRGIQAVTPELRTLCRRLVQAELTRRATPTDTHRRPC